MTILPVHRHYLLPISEIFLKPSNRSSSKFGHINITIPLAQRQHHNTDNKHCPCTRPLRTIIQTAYLISACGNGAEAGWQDILRAGANRMVVLHGHSSDSRGALHLRHSPRMITINSSYGLLEWFAQVLPYLTLLFLYYVIPSWIL
jgi:hypothetical protein